MWYLKELTSQVGYNGGLPGGGWGIGQLLLKGTGFPLVEDYVLEVNTQHGEQSAVLSHALQRC